MRTTFARRSEAGCLITLNKTRNTDIFLSYLCSDLIAHEKDLVGVVLLIFQVKRNYEFPRAV